MQSTPLCIKTINVFVLWERSEVLWDRNSGNGNANIKLKLPLAITSPQNLEIIVICKTSMSKTKNLNEILDNLTSQNSKYDFKIVKKMQRAKALLKKTK